MKSVDFIRAFLKAAPMLGVALHVVGCSPGENQTTDQPTQAAPSTVFVGCTPPFPAAGGRKVTRLSYQEGRNRTARELQFDVTDPNLAPAIHDDDRTLYWAFPLSPAGAQLVRANAKRVGNPALYRGMSKADQYSIDMVTFHARPITFDEKAGYGKPSTENDLPTDTLMFLEPGWVVTTIVPKEKVRLAPAFRASASAGLAALLPLQAGCQPSSSRS